MSIEPYYTEGSWQSGQLQLPVEQPALRLQRFESFTTQ